MKANELRIGNYVKAPLGEIMRVDQVGHLDFPDYIHARNETEFGQNGFEGIELTPEILEKCGFGLYDNYTDESLGDFIFESYRKWKSKYIYIAIHNRQEGGYDCGLSRQLTDVVPVDKIDANSFNVCELIYLHQLQNIYFALTGEELEVKL